MPQYHRIARLESVLKKEIADIISHEINIDFGLTTVTKVILSGDLRHLKAYISVYGEEAKQKRVLTQIRNHTGFVRGLIGRRIRMRYIPEIDFIHDKSMEEVTHIFKLLQDIQKEKS